MVVGGGGGGWWWWNTVQRGKGLMGVEAHAVSGVVLCIWVHCAHCCWFVFYFFVCLFFGFGFGVACCLLPVASFSLHTWQAALRVSGMLRSTTRGDGQRRLISCRALASSLHATTTLSSTTSRFQSSSAQLPHSSTGVSCVLCAVCCVFGCQTRVSYPLPAFVSVHCLTVHCW